MCNICTVDVVSQNGSMTVEENESLGKGSGTGLPIPDPSSSPNEDSSPLNSFEVFEQCIKRAENLISIHVSTESIEEISDQHYCDCYRAAVVLAISALDAFVRKIVISGILKQINSNGALNPKLSEYLKGLLNQDKLLDAARKSDLNRVVEEAVRADFETVSFQGDWKISSFMEMIGFKDIYSDVSMKANVNEKNLKRDLGIYTKRRHVIAHSGDYDLNRMPHNENTIDKDFAVNCIGTVRMFAQTIHLIVESK